MHHPQAMPDPVTGGARAVRRMHHPQAMYGSSHRWCAGCEEVSVGCRMDCDTLQNVDEIDARIDVVELAGLDEAVDVGHQQKELGHL